MNLPARFTAGDTLKFSETLADYQASAGWALSFALINSASKITFSGSASGDDHAVNVAASVTASWLAGSYSFAAYVTKGTERYSVGTGTITIAPNLAALSTVDGRTHARKTLDAIEAVIEGRASIDQLEYSIAGRSLKRTPLPDLLKFRDRYRAEVKSEEAAANVAAGLGNGRTIRVRF